MNAEELKVIATGMGYESSIQCFEGCSCFITYKSEVDGDKNCTVTELYNPLNNAEQLLEIMEKCFINIEHSEGIIIAETMQQKRGIPLGWAEGKTIPEAVCNAAFKYFGGE